MYDVIKREVVKSCPFNIHAHILACHETDKTLIVKWLKESSSFNLEPAECPS